MKIEPLKQTFIALLKHTPAGFGLLVLTATFIHFVIIEDESLYMSVINNQNFHFFELFIASLVLILIPVFGIFYCFKIFLYIWRKDWAKAKFSLVVFSILLMQFLFCNLLNGEYFYRQFIGYESFSE